MVPKVFHAVWKSEPHELLATLSLDDTTSTKEGDRETGRLGDWETGRPGDWETGRLGDWETGRLGDRSSVLSGPQPDAIVTL